MAKEQEVVNNHNNIGTKMYKIIKLSNLVGLNKKGGGNSNKYNRKRA